MALFMAVFAAAGVGVVAQALAATETIKVADHPQAFLQSTASGKVLHTLKSWNGKIYSGFGDYSANTGPIGITPFDGNAFGAQALAADTEAIFQFREVNGSLYALSADPKSSADVAIGTSVNGVDTWINKRFVGTTHAYDIFTYTGTDLWLIGSQGTLAKAWRSLDGGLTWQESLAVANVNTTRTDDFARFYGAVKHNGKLYVQGRDYYGGTHPTSKVFDGRTWTDGPYIGTFNSSSEFAGQSIYHTSFHVANAASLSKFDGTRSVSVLPSYIYNYTIDGDTLYALLADGLGTVVKTTDLVSWTTIGSSTALARSIAVLNGQIYVGGTDAAIYRVNITSSDLVPPSTQLSSPANGASVAGIVQVSGTASDNVGVAKVELLVDNTVQASDTTAPYTMAWDTTTRYANGMHTLAYRAYDAIGNASTSPVVTVNVANVPDTIAPALRIKSPLNNSTISRNARVKITATATDNMSVVRSEVYVDGVLHSTVSGGNINLVWSAKEAAAGPHTMLIKAYDGAGNVGQGQVVVNK